MKIKSQVYRIVLCKLLSIIPVQNVGCPLDPSTELDTEQMAIE